MSLAWAPLYTPAGVNMPEEIKVEPVEEYDGSFDCLICSQSVRGTDALECSQCQSNPIHRACVTNYPSLRSRVLRAKGRLSRHGVSRALPVAHQSTESILQAGWRGRAVAALQGTLWALGTWAALQGTEHALHAHQESTRVSWGQQTV